MAQFNGLTLWIRSLIATVVSAAAGAIPVMVVDPEHFNLRSGWKDLLAVCAVTGLIALANFLKQHPVPDLEPPLVVLSGPPSQGV